MNHTIDYVRPIGESRGQLVRTMAGLESLIERPLLPACQYLYDMNVRTLESDANATSISRGYGGIVIDFDSLSERNKAIALENFVCSRSGDGHNIAEIRVPIERADLTVNEISRRALGLARKLEYQLMTWEPKYTLQELLKAFALREDEGYTPEHFVRQGYFYDPKSGLFYVSEEHFRKSQPRVRVVSRVRVLED